MRPVARVRDCRVASLVVLIAGLAAGALVGCSKPQSAAAPVPAAPAAQRTFASPEEAGAAMLDAAKSGDHAALAAIFGPGSEGALLSGDAVKDKDTLQDFVAAYAQMHRWRPIRSGGEILAIGADNFLFPVPLDRNAQGQWQFDTDAGKDEILARRIGRDELTAIATCEAVAKAQDQYFRQTHNGDSVHQYARKFVSDEGKQDGLYWPAVAGKSPSPLGELGDFAKAAGYTSAGSQPQPFNGYYFRILTRQGAGAKSGAKDFVAAGKMTGGFAVIAYPVEYRNSGIMTFIAATDGVVYQKDLGDSSATLGPSMSEYDPADGWSPAI